MLRLLRFRQLDPARWDACCAAAHPAAALYVRWRWLAATAGRWAAVVELGPAGEYHSLLPLPWHWRPAGRVGYQPPFTQQLGLVLTPDSQHLDLAEYLALAETLCAQVYQQLPPGEPLPPLPPGWQAAERRTYHIDLGHGYEAIQAAYAPDYRRRLRRNAEAAQPLAVAESREPDELISLFLSYKTAADTGLRPRQYHALRVLWPAVWAYGAAELRQVRHPATKELLAGALFITHPGGVIYLFAAASAAGRAAGAPLLLVDDALRRHAGAGPGRVFDFEGGSRPELGRFFANFGARPVQYPTLSYSRPSWLLSWMRP